MAHDDSPRETMRKVMRIFTAKTDGPNRLGLRELLQRDADEQWIAGHMTPEQAAESVMDCFRRAVRAELELLDIECREAPDQTDRRGLAD